MSQVDVNLLTTGVVQGSGVFDVLMKSVTSHLDQEYGKNRITGAQYSEVYLGAMSSAMQQAVAYIQGSYQRDLIEAQVALTEAQKDKAVIDIELAEQQVIQAEKQIEILELQKDKNAAEIALLEQRTQTEAAQTGDIATGILGKQQALYEAQTEGFARKAEVDVAKLHADLWSMLRTTDSDIPIFSSANADAMNAVFNKLYAGIQ